MYVCVESLQLEMVGLTKFTTVQCTCNLVAFEMVASKMGDQICVCLWSVAKIKIKKSIVIVKAKYSDYTEQLNNQI